MLSTLSLQIMNNGLPDPIDELLIQQKYTKVIIETTQRLSASKTHHLLFQRALALSHLGDYSTALEDLIAANQIAPESVPIACQLAFCLIQTGHTIEALKMYVCVIQERYVDPFKSQLKHAIDVCIKKLLSQGVAQNEIDQIYTSSLRTIVEAWPTLKQKKRNILSGSIGSAGSEGEANPNVFHFEVPGSDNTVVEFGEGLQNFQTILANLRDNILERTERARNTAAAAATAATAAATASTASTAPAPVSLDGDHNTNTNNTHPTDTTSTTGASATGNATRAGPSRFFATTTTTTNGNPLEEQMNSLVNEAMTRGRAHLDDPDSPLNGILNMGTNMASIINLVTNQVNNSNRNSTNDANSASSNTQNAPPMDALDDEIDVD